MAAQSKRKDELVALGDLIRARRNELGMNQFELADRAQVGRNYIGQVERGELEPRFLRLGLLIQALEISADELFSSHSAFK